MNDKIPVGSIPRAAANELPGAQIIGNTASGTTKLFLIDNIVGGFKGIATPTTVIPTPFLSQQYALTLPVFPVTELTYNNLGGLVVPLKVGNQYVFEPKATWNNTSWVLSYGLITASAGADGSSVVSATGTVLPTPTGKAISFVSGPATYTYTGGSIAVTEKLSQLSWDLTSWSIGAAIPIQDATNKVDKVTGSDLVETVKVVKLDEVTAAVKRVAIKGTYNTDSAGNIAHKIDANGKTWTLDLESKKITGDQLKIGQTILKFTSKFKEVYTDEAGNIGYAVTLDGQILGGSGGSGGGGSSNNNLTGKKVFVLGDSISTPGDLGTTSVSGGSSSSSTVWHQIMKSKWGCLTFVNAIAGSSIGLGNGGTSESFVVDTRWQSGNSTFDPDIIIVFGGTNDNNFRALPLGTIDDPDTLKTTFYGALKYLYKSLTTRYPSALIFAMTPLHRGINGIPEISDTTGLPLSKFVTAIKEIVPMYGGTVIDTYSESGFTPINAALTNYSADGVHPKDYHHAKLADLVGNKLNNRFKTV
jgi:hypothetical protein